MKYGCCKNCNCASKKIKDPGCDCGNHELEEKWIDMAKRITIMIDDDLDKKVRLIQAKEIIKTSSSISYSRVLNDVLRKQLK